MIDLTVSSLDLEEVKGVILDNYDFQSILDVMDVLDWDYWYGRPTIDDLKSTVSNLLSLLFEKESRGERAPTMSSGGFVLTKHSFGVEIFFRVQKETVYLF